MRIKINCTIRNRRACFWLFSLPENVFILFFEKGKRKLNNLGIPDILEHKRVYRRYPTEKPVPLIKQLVEQSSKEGEVVIDPFFGSGATLVAATQLNRIAIGCDISDYAHEEASSRKNDRKT